MGLGWTARFVGGPKNGEHLTVPVRPAREQRVKNLGMCVACPESSTPSQQMRRCYDVGEYDVRRLAFFQHRDCCEGCTPFACAFCEELDGRTIPAASFERARQWWLQGTPIEKITDALDHPEGQP
jgi:hypothetical protein